MRFFKICACIITLCILIFMSVFFGSFYAFYGAFLLAVILILDVILFLLPFGGVEAEITSDKTVCTKGEKCIIYIRLKNKRPFPLYRASFDLLIKNKLYEGEKISIEATLPVFKSKKIVIPIVMEKSGIIDIRAENMVCSDAFGFFSKGIDLAEFYSVAVMPLGENVEDKAFGTVVSDEIPSANVYLSNEGDVSGYREYRGGDRINNINWKLLAGKDKIYVREFERTSADEAVVLLNMNIDKLDKALDLLYGIGSKGGTFTLLWLPAGNEEFESQCISDRESLDEAVYRIYASAPDVRNDNGLYEYKRLYRENTVLYISDKMELL